MPKSSSNWASDPNCDRVLRPVEHVDNTGVATPRTSAVNALALTSDGKTPGICRS